MPKDEMKGIDKGISLNKDVVNILFEDLRKRKKRLLWMEVLL